MRIHKHILSNEPGNPEFIFSTETEDGNTFKIFTKNDNDIERIELEMDQFVAESLQRYLTRYIRRINNVTTDGPMLNTVGEGTTRVVLGAGGGNNSSGSASSRTRFWPQPYPPSVTVPAGAAIESTEF